MCRCASDRRRPPSHSAPGPAIALPHLLALSRRPPHRVFPELLPELRPPGADSAGQFTFQLQLPPLAAGGRAGASSGRAAGGAGGAGGVGFGSSRSSLLIVRQSREAWPAAARGEAAGGAAPPFELVPGEVGGPAMFSNSILSSELNGGPLSAVPGTAPSVAAAGPCWICDGWREVEFRLDLRALRSAGADWIKADASGAPAPESVSLHLSLDGYRPFQMVKTVLPAAAASNVPTASGAAGGAGTVAGASAAGWFEAVRMAPPTLIAFFFVVDGVAVCSPADALAANAAAAGADAHAAEAASDHAVVADAVPVTFLPPPPAVPRQSAGGKTAAAGAALGEPTPLAGIDLPQTLRSLKRLNVRAVLPAGMAGGGTGADPRAAMRRGTTFAALAAAIPAAAPHPHAAPPQAAFKLQRVSALRPSCDEPRSARSVCAYRCGDSAGTSSQACCRCGKKGAVVVF
jgi:hypothetical protein